MVLTAAAVLADGTNGLPLLTLADAQALGAQIPPANRPRGLSRPGGAEVVTETRAGFFPTVNLYGTAAGANSEDTRIMAGFLNNPSVFDRAAGGLQLNQLMPILAAPTTSRPLEAASAGGQPKRQHHPGTVLLQAATAYYGALGAQAVLHVTQQTLTTRQLLLDQVVALATNKLRSQLDASFAQVQVQQAQLLVERLRTTPTPRWRRFRRRWATASFTNSNLRTNRRRPTP